MRLPGPGKRTGGRWKPGAARPRPAPPDIKGQVAGDVVGAWASPPLWAIARFGEADLLQQVSERAGGPYPPHLRASANGSGLHIPPFINLPG